MQGLSISCRGRQVFIAVISLLLISAVMFARSSSATSYGDVAPYGNPDGALTSADLAVLRQFLDGVLTPTVVEQQSCDVAPLGAPDGVLNAGDYVLLERAVLGGIDLGFRPAAPVLWSGAATVPSSPWLISGLGSPLQTIRLYVDGGLRVSAVASANGLFSFSVDLVAGQAHALHATTVQQGFESDSSNMITLTYRPPPAALDKRMITVSNIAGATRVTGLPGSSSAGSTVWIHFTDGTNLSAPVMLDGSFSLITMQGYPAQVASISVRDGNGVDSEPTVYRTPGSIRGSFEVDGGGAAGYSIPIGVPPGTSGMTPSLSVNFSSHSANGLLGRGWVLGGLSVITRCPRTVAQDGVPGGINLDTQDRYCLDGVRLVAVGGGVYGADQTEYREDSGTFTRIISYGGSNGTPDYFMAWSRSGQKMRFGFETDSGFDPGGGTVVAWALDRVEDLQGNYFSVNYFEDTVTGEHYPEAVEYTGNDRTGLLPYNRVSLVYEDRPDSSFARLGGQQFDSRRRIARIEVIEDTSVIREYRLDYDVSPTSGQSRLRAITECDSSAADAACLMPTHFDWSNGDVFLAAVSTGTANAGYGDAVVLDANADGRQDLLVPHNGYWWINYGDRSGLQAERSTGIPTSGYYTGKTVQLDYNGDGLSDLLVPGTDGFWDLLQAGPAGLVLIADILPSAGYDRFPQAIDIDGDGLQDLVLRLNGTRKVYLNSSHGFLPLRDSGLSPLGNVEVQIDYRNDGRLDLLSAFYRGYVNGVETCEFWLFYYDGQSFRQEMLTDVPFDARGVTAGCRAMSSSSGNVHVADVNADGLQDLVYFSGTAEYWRFLINSGKGLNGASVETGLSDSNRWYARALDYNLDGRVDFLVPASADGRWHVYKSGDGVAYDINTGLVTDGYQNAQVMDVNGDGLQDLVVPANGVWKFMLRDGQVTDQLTAITDGLGRSTYVTYRPLTDASVYTRESAAVFPEQELLVPALLVSTVRSDDGAGGDYLTEYQYGGARLHVQGRGLLGFHTKTVTDPQTGIVTLTTSRLDYPFSGMPERVDTYVDGRLISSMEYSYIDLAAAASGVHAIYPEESLEQSYELPEDGMQGALLRSVRTSNSYDSLGNPVSSRVDTTDIAGQVFGTLTTHSYEQPDTVDWVLDKAIETSVVYSAPGVPDITRTSGFSYYPPGHPSAHLLQDEIVEPGLGTDSPYYLVTHHEYDDFGNQVRVVAKGLKRHASTSQVEERITETGYDSRGRFPVWTRNALGHTENYSYDARFGVRSGLTGPNLLQTRWVYDGFGRKVQEQRADGTQTTTHYSFCDMADCPHGGYAETTTVTAGITSTNFYDSRERLVRVATESLSGRTVLQDTGWDNRGNTGSRTRPYFKGGAVAPAAVTTRFEYDVLNRPLHEYAPDDSVVDYLYTGYARQTHRYLTGSTIDQVDTRINDVMGRLVQVIDAGGGSRSYRYDAIGNLTETADSQANTITTDYDLRGRKTSMIDPDLGHWEYRYNAFGDLVFQKDAKSQLTYLYYDRLGRMTRRIEPEGESTWSWDGAAHGIGKLATATYVASGHTRTLEYDALGRLDAETGTMDGRTFTMAYSYDGAGRRETVAYPSGYLVRNVYDTRGFLVEVRDAASDRSYWRAEDDDASGHVTMESLGNGLQTLRNYDSVSGLPVTISTGVGTGSQVQNLVYTFDVLGNLVAREDRRQGNSEAFIYDDQNRVSSATLAGIGTQTFSYDSLGNITGKSDYASSYTYGGAGAGPHAVTAVRNGATQLASYSYDANGNMTSGAGRMIRWTSFNKAEEISRNTATVRFAYDAGHERVKQVRGGTVTYYVNPSLHQGINYEEENDGTVTVYRHYINAGGRAIAIHTSQSDGVQKTRYLHTDHLGSIDVVSDEAGTVIERMSFSPFGSRRNPDWMNTGAVLFGVETHHGFTGHEHLDEVGLIHMNGRLYDPGLGRFLSPDVSIQYQDQTQSFNRYTYVNNNPLSFTDPSGFGFFSRLWKKIQGFVAVVAAVVIGYITFGWGIVYFGTIQGALMTGLTFAGLTYGALTGGIRGAVKGALTGFSIANALVGIQGIAQSLVSGLRAVMQKLVTPGEALEHLVNFGLHHFTQMKFRAEAGRFARRHGMSLFELNMGLELMSFAGAEFFGYDRLRVNGDESFGAAGGEPGIAGIFQNGIKGAIFDAADVALTFQGLPTAQGLSLVGQCGGRINSSCLGSNFRGTLYGHSQGAAEISTLKGLGLIDKTVGLQVYSLPFTQISPGGMGVAQGSRDLVNIGVFGHLMNIGSDYVKQYGYSLKDMMQFETHKCGKAYSGCGF